MRVPFLSMASIVAISVASSSALAQTADEVDALRQQIETQQQQLEAMQQRLDELQQQTQEAQQAAQEASEAAAPGNVIESGEDRISLEISGQVNRAINVAYDGDDTGVYNVDNDNSSTRFRFVGKGQVNDNFSISPVLEFQVESNSSSNVSQDNEDTGTANVTDRKAEVIFDHKQFGRVSLGQGSTASDGTAEVDLSGTDVIGYSSVVDLAGGLQFRDKDGELTGIEIGDVFDNFDGLSREDRIRYDSPRFAGFQVSGDIISDERWSTAVRWAGDFGGIKAAAAAAYSDPNEDDNDYIIDGSASVLHEGTGLNLTLSAGQQDDRSAYNLYGKLGWIGNFFEIGSTNFSIDYDYSEDIREDGDTAQTSGGFIVQNWDDYGTEFFTGVRWHDLDANDVDTDSVWVFTFGSRIKF